MKKLKQSYPQIWKTQRKLNYNHMLMRRKLKKPKKKPKKRTKIKRTKKKRTKKKKITKKKTKKNNAKGHTPLAIRTMYKKTRKKALNKSRIVLTPSPKSIKEMKVILRHSPSILRTKKRYHIKSKKRKPSKLRFNSTAQTLAEIKESKKISPYIVSKSGHWDDWDHLKQLSVKPIPKKQTSIRVKIKKSSNKLQKGSRWSKSKSRIKSFKKAIKNKFKRSTK